MNKLLIVWTKLAEQELDDIINYWDNRNKSTIYTTNLLKRLKKTVTILSSHPSIGKKSLQRKNVRIMVFMENFLIIYRTENTYLYILDFWDTRKNPESNKYL